jgi:hypothetical protein
VISDQELRSLVRDAIARHTGQEGPQASTPAPPSGFGGHASHRLLPLARGSDGDGACLIEPAVRCNHCGYCLSYGH